MTPFDHNTVLYCLVNGVTTNDGFYPPEPKATSTKCRGWDIKKTNDGLGSNVCLVILFIHAILGCDTTSRLQRIGKSTFLKKVSNNTVFLEIAKDILL